MKIKLNEIEDELVKQVAKARTAISRKDGVPNQKISEADDFEVEYVGMAGEVAVAKAMNVFPDLSIHSRSGGYDLMSAQGNRVEVKTTRYHSGKLVARLKASAKDSDYYVLVTGNPPNMTLRGHVRTEDFLREVNIGKLSDDAPEAYILPQEALTEWHSQQRKQEHSTNKSS
jgi:hypothetical protein